MRSPADTPAPPVPMPTEVGRERLAALPPGIRELARALADDQEED